MNIKWLFEIKAEDTEYFWSFYDTTWNGREYIGKIVSNSFGGMTEARAGDSSGLINPSDTTFKIATVPEGLDILDTTGEEVYSTAPFFENQFKDKICTLRLVVDNIQERVWTLRVKRCEMMYGGAKFWMESILNAYLEGDHPTTKHPRDIWPSSDSDKDDDENFERQDPYVVPEVFGSAYIPVRSVNTGIDRYYVLGKEGYNYNISEVRSPKEWGNQSVWSGTKYSFPQSTNLGYQLCRALIYPSAVEDGVFYNGLWKGGDYYYDMPCKYTSTEISASPNVNPAIVIEKVLRDFGIPATYIDSFASAEAEFNSRGINWNGGFYNQITREKRLTNLLNQCGASIHVTDKIELHPIDTTPRKIITSSNIKKESFSYRPVWASLSDGGYIQYIQGDNTPQDRPSKTLVWSNPTQANKDDVSNPESSELNLRYVRDSVVAQKLGVLFYNRKLDKYGINSFTVIPNRSYLNLRPDQVVTLAHDLYGEDRNVLIKSITINKDLSVDLECIEFKNGVIGFEGSPSPIPEIEDNAEAWEPPTTAAPWIGIKPNYASFNTPRNGYAYIHGYNVHGGKVDQNGKINYGGDISYVPKNESPDSWTISTSQNFDGYIVFDTTKSGKFTVESNPHSVAFCKKESGQWSYDNGSSWVDFSPASTDTVIGVISRGATSIESANVSPNGSALGTIVDQNADNTSDGIVPLLEIQGWQFTGTFSATASNTVSWTAGDLTFSSGEVFSISSGSTGNMSSRTYIYFSRNLSETALRTTTISSNAVGANTVMIAVAENSMSDQAWFYVYGGSGGLNIDSTSISDKSISTPKIQANAVTANEIASNTITANEIASNTITASQIASGTITTFELNFSPVKTDNIIGSINASTEGIVIAGDNIELNGNTTVSGNFKITALSNISDVESGADVTGSNTAYDTSRVNGVAASIVKNNASVAYTRTENWKYDSTYIDGSKIYTGTITANQLNVVDLSAVSAEVGTVTATWPGYVGFANNNGVYRGRIIGNSSSLDIESPTGITLEAGEGNENIFLRGTLINLVGPTVTYGGIFPAQTTDFLGSSSNVWHQLHTKETYTYGGIRATTNNAMDIGSSTKLFKSIFAYNFFDENGLFQDLQDDLHVVNKIKPKKNIRDKESGLEIIDPLTLPRWMTNYEDLKKEVKDEMGEMIDLDADFDELLQDDDELGYRLKRNVKHFNDLTNGAVRQLDKKVNNTVEQLSGLIEDLHKRIDDLEKQIREKQNVI